MALRGILHVTIVFMIVMALTGLVFRWIGTSRELYARRWDVAPPFERVGGSSTRSPLATGAWWTNLHLDEGDPAVATPYAVRGAAGGALEVCYGAAHRSTTTTSVVDAFVADLVVSAGGDKDDGHEHDRKIVRADELTADYSFAAAATAVLARGSPYVTVRVDGARVRIDAAAGIRSVAPLGGDASGDVGVNTFDGPPSTTTTPDDASCASRADCGGLVGDCCPTAAGVFLGCCGRRRLSKAKGTAFAVELNDASKWLLFVSKAVEWEEDGGGAWRVKDTFRGVLRVAYVPDDAGERMLVEAAGTFPVRGKVSWRAARNMATLRFRWQTETTGATKAPLVGLALPHHVETLAGGHAATGFKSLKGQLVAVSGDVWTFREALAWAGNKRVNRTSTCSSSNCVGTILELHGKHSTRENDSSKKEAHRLRLD